MTELVTFIRDAINSGDIATVYQIIHSLYSNKNKDDAEYDRVELKIRVMTRKYISYGIPDLGAIELIASVIGFDTAVEVGAGNGFWAALVKHRLEKIGCGGTIFATDNFSLPKEYDNYTEVENLEAVEAVKKYSMAKVLILIWPPRDDPMAFNALSEFKGDYVIYIGEPQGYSTGDNNFHQLLSAEWEEAKGYFTEDGNFHRCLPDEWNEANSYFTEDVNSHQLLSYEL